MKTLKILLGSGAMIALLGFLLGFLNVAQADIRNDSIQPLKFDVDAGDGSVSMPQITFDSGGAAEESQQTCAMTPGGSMPGLLLEQQFATPPDPEHLTHPPDVTLAPISSLQTPPPYNPRRGYPDDPTPPGTPEIPVDPDEPPPPPVTPEPTTLLLVGLGIAGAAVARRRWGRA